MHTRSDQPCRCPGSAPINIQPRTQLHNIKHNQLARSRYPTTQRLNYLHRHTKPRRRAHPRRNSSRKHIQINR